MGRPATRVGSRRGGLIVLAKTCAAAPKHRAYAIANTVTTTLIILALALSRGLSQHLLALVLEPA
jgi:hypothetical protein